MVRVMVISEYETMLTCDKVLIESVGFSEKMARLLAAVNSVSYLLFSTIGIPNVERWGRRKMLMYAAAGQCFCYLIITVMIRYNELEGYAHQTEVAKASVAFFFLYYVFFGIGFQGKFQESGCGDRVSADNITLQEYLGSIPPRSTVYR